MKKDTKSGSSKATSKKYKAPKLTEYGSVRQFTQALSGTSTKTDGGVIVPSTSTTTMTCLTPTPFMEEHRLLLADPSCQNTFRKAILETVKPGDVVLDLGCGSGLHSFFACEAGAKKVYAIDSEPIIELARMAAKDNGLDDRIQFIYGLFKDVQLPEKVDVIVTNLGFRGVLRSLADAAARFLKPGGRMVPSQTFNSFVPADVGRLHEDTIQFWENKVYGYDFGAFKHFAIHRPYYSDFSKEKFLAEPVDMEPINYDRPLQSSYSWEQTTTATADGRINGLVGWYTFKLTEETSLSTKPPLALAPEIWSQHMLPLAEPMMVKKGEKITINASLHLKSGGEETFWSWAVRVGDRLSSQSTFDGIPFTERVLNKISH